MPPVDPEFRLSQLVPLIGTVNGVNREFVTPSAFKAGTLRVFWNGVEYEPWDERRGWVEVSDVVVRMSVAPKTGDVLTCYYQEVCLIPGIWNVKGSPIDPNGIFP